MSDSKIVKAATGTVAVDYVIVLQRKTDYHPITGRGSHYVEVRVIKPSDKEGSEFVGTPTTNASTPKVGIVASDFQIRPHTASSEAITASFSEGAIKQILITPDDFIAVSGLGRETIQTFVADGIDIDDLRKAFKGLRVALENDEIPVLHATSVSGSVQFVKQPYGFIGWVIAHNLDDMTRLRKIKEERNEPFNLGAK